MTATCSKEGGVFTNRSVEFPCHGWISALQVGLTDSAASIL